jgi:pimeloyl-ACP methyl ester carboxylesterase
MLDPAIFYKSREGYAAMMAWYDDALRRLPAVAESLTVATRYGPTHVLAAGPRDAPPVVLAHALGGNALMWSRQIAALSSEHRVLAPDIIGMTGRSAPIRLPYDGRGYADWLRQTLDGLGVREASFVGLAFGAWLVMKFAALEPERVRRAALLSPAGFLPVRWKYLVPVIWDILFLNDEQARRLSHLLLAPPGASLDEQAAEMLYLSIKHYQTPFEAPAVPPAQIARLTAPTLVLVGEHEDVWNPRELLSHVRATVPNLRAAEVVHGAGHGLTASHPEHVNARLLRFLRDDA